MFTKQELTIDKKNKTIIIISLLLAILACFSLLAMFLFNPEPNVLVENTEKSSQSLNSAGIAKTSDSQVYTAELTYNEIIELVEQIDPYELEPTMTPKERYDLRKEICRGLETNAVNTVFDGIHSCALQLSLVCADERYQELINQKNTRWDFYDTNNLYGVSTVLKGVIYRVSYPPLVADLETAVRLSEEGLTERNILKILDANRILQDLSRHLLDVPHEELGDEPVDYGNTHAFYFKVTETLEGRQTLMSE